MVRAAASAFRVNDAFDTETALQALGVGEALVSFLDAEGVPCVVERARILPPQSLIGPAEEAVVAAAIAADELEIKYREPLDRESAYEILLRANEELEAARREQAEAEAAEKQRQTAEMAAAKKA